MCSKSRDAFGYEEINYSFRFQHENKTISHLEKSFFFLNSYKVSSPSITLTTTRERLQQSRITKYILPAI